MLCRDMGTGGNQVEGTAVDLADSTPRVDGGSNRERKKQVKLEYVRIWSKR